MSKKYEEVIKALIETTGTSPDYIALIASVNPNGRKWEEIALICFTAGYVSGLEAEEKNKLTRPYIYKKESE